MFTTVVLKGKGIVHLKMKLFHHLFILVSFQTCRTFFHLQDTQENILRNVGYQTSKHLLFGHDRCFLVSSVPQNVFICVLQKEEKVFSLFSSVTSSNSLSEKSLERQCALSA